jgi:hypothetical protein
VCWALVAHQLKMSLKRRRRRMVVVMQNSRLLRRLPHSNSGAKALWTNLLWCALVECVFQCMNHLQANQLCQASLLYNEEHI